MTKQRSTPPRRAVLRRAGAAVALALAMTSLVAASALAQGIQRPGRTGPIGNAPPPVVVPPPIGVPVPANPGDLVNALSPQSIVSILQGEGYNAKLITDGVGDPAIEGEISKSHYFIYFYGCTDHVDCKSIQYTTGYNGVKGLTLEKMNAWNVDNLWGQAYLDEDEVAWLSITVNLDGGVTRTNFVDTVGWFHYTTEAFEDHIGW